MAELDIANVAELPLDATSKNYTVTTTLDGDTFTFAVRWNPGRPPLLSGSWFFDLFDASGNMIIAGRRIVLGTILGHRSRDPRMPKGALIASALDGGGDAGRDDLGVRVKLYYYPVKS